MYQALQNATLTSNFLHILQSFNCCLSSKYALTLPMRSVFIININTFIYRRIHTVSTSGSGTSFQTFLFYFLIFPNFLPNLGVANSHPPHRSPLPTMQGEGHHVFPPADFIILNCCFCNIRRWHNTHSAFTCT